MNESQLKKPTKYTKYYSRYAFKNDTHIKGQLLYQGKIENCSEQLLGQTKVDNFKFIRVWA